MANSNYQFRPFSSVVDEMEKNFQRLWRNHHLLGNHLGEDDLGNWLPAIDIKEEDNHYLIRADVPGVDAENIKMGIDSHNNLIIEGTREVDEKREKKGYVRVERQKGSFYRRISLPRQVNAEKITAKHKNGVVEIILPKTKKTTLRKIDVESED